VHNVGLDEDLEGLEEVIEVAESFGLIESSQGPDFLLKGASVAELIDEVVVVGCFEDLDEPDDMRGVFNFAESLDLVDGELF
jgi:hypothetical protein